MSGNLKHVREMSGKSLVREKCPKTVHYQLNICVQLHFFLVASLADLYSHTFKFVVPVSRFCLPLLFKLH